MIIKKVSRPWGDFKQFVKNKECTVKILSVKKNETHSLQKHKERKEMWYFLTDGYVQIGNEIKKIKKNEHVEIPKKEIHRLFAKRKDVEVIEISFGKFDEKDEIRLYDEYGRQ